MQEVSDKSRVDSKVWYLLLAIFLIGLLVDFGSTLYSIFIVTPLHLPDLGTVAIFLWFLFSTIIFRALTKHFNNGVVPRITDILSFLFAFGFGVYMVGNSVQAKLWILKYNDELAYAASYPGVDSKLLPVFKLIYFYDEVLGHILIFFPYFFLLIVAYVYSLRPSQQLVADEQGSSWSMYVITILNSLYFAWAVVEGQSVLLYIAVCAILLATKCYFTYKGYVPGLFSRIVEGMFLGAFVWIFIWWGAVGHFKQMPQVLETLGRWLGIAG